MTKWNELVKVRMAELGITQDKLAERLGVTQGGLGHWLNGRREPSLDTINRILAELGMPQLAVTTTEHANVHKEVESQKAERGYPVISWVAAGMWAESGEQLHPREAEEFITSAENAGVNGYWLTVEGESMTSTTGFSFAPGMRILVKPEGFDLISGKLYIARLATGETTFKQYVRDAGVEYLKPLNPAFRLLEMGDDVRIIGRVIDAKAPRSVF
jgi:SOS-response transcriptional repressor LexA